LTKGALGGGAPQGRNALAFELDAEARLVALQQALRDRSYRPGLSIWLITNGPKRGKSSSPRPGHNAAASLPSTRLISW